MYNILLANIPQQIHFEVLVDELWLKAYYWLMYYIVSQIKEMQSCIKLVIKIPDNYIGLYPGFLDVHGYIAS